MTGQLILSAICIVIILICFELGSDE